jgi:hypothetical protein
MKKVRSLFSIPDSQFLVLTLAAAVFSAACDRSSGGSASAGAPQIRLNLHSPGSATVDVVDLPADDLDALRGGELTQEQWTALLRVEVGSSEPSLASPTSVSSVSSVSNAVGTGTQAATDLPAVLGSYAVTDEVLRFAPQFPLDPGQRYNVTLDPSRLPSAQGSNAQSMNTIKATIEIPAPTRAPSTQVVAVYPSGPELPENQLRLYIVFSAPMGLRDGAPHIKLLDDHGMAVVDPFLPLAVDLWNENRTRYTLLFDPGRVKRGILPNEEMGPSLIAGRKYTLVVEPGWNDAGGRPLVAAFRHEFRVGPPQERAIDPAEWRIDVPKGGTRDALAVSFPKPLDYGLLNRALSISSGSGQWLDGNIELQRSETRWMFTPRLPWKPGEYRLVAAPILEDVAGNRIGRPFEVAFLNGRSTGSASGAVLPFQIEGSRGSKGSRGSRGSKSF